METALVLPLMLMVVFAMIDFGRMLNAQIRVTEAAREGARALTLVGEEEADAVAGTVIGRPPTPLVNEDGFWRGDSHRDCADDDSQASYRIVYGFAFITPLGALVGVVDKHLIELTATAVMPCRS